MVFFKEDLRAVILGGFTSHSWTQAVIAIPSSFEAPTFQGSKKQTKRKVTATKSKKCVFCYFKRKIAYHVQNRYTGNFNLYLLFCHLGWSRVCQISKGRLIRREIIYYRQRILWISHGQTLFFSTSFILQKGLSFNAAFYS